MKLTRRRFLECTGAVVAGTGLGALVPGLQGNPRQHDPLQALRASNSTSPGCPTIRAISNDISCALRTTRVSGGKRVVQAITTPQEVVDRQKTVVAELWKMLGDPPERTPLNARVTGRSIVRATGSRS